MYKIRQKDKLSVQVKGLGNDLVSIVFPIKYEVRVDDGNWTKYFGKYQNQKWGNWDSDSCWCLSAINCAEDQLEWLWKNGMFSAETKSFFQNNGYIDSDGDFSLSERFHEILCNNKDNGGTPQQAWQSFKSRGFIPRSKLDYSLEQSSKFFTKTDFNNDYFNPNYVTKEMKDLGLKCLEHIKIDYHRIGNLWQTPNRKIIQAALKQAPVNYGVPIPRIKTNWNKSPIQYDGLIAMHHEIEGYYLPDSGEYYIFDQYLPNLKVLSSDYYIPSCFQGIINAVKPASVNPVAQPQGEMNNTFWTWVMAWFNKMYGSPVPVGSA